MQLRCAPVSAVKISVCPGKFTQARRNAYLWITRRAELENLFGGIGGVIEIECKQQRAPRTGDGVQVPVRLSVTQDSLTAHGIALQIEILEHRDFTPDARDRFNEIRKLEQRFQTEVEPVARRDATGQSVVSLGAQFIGRGRDALASAVTVPTVMRALVTAQVDLAACGKNGRPSSARRRYSRTGKPCLRRVEM